MDIYKLALIYGKNDELRQIHDGQIKKIGNVLEEELLHATCLLDHAKEIYPNVTIFKQLNNRHRPETIGYFFTLLGNILFLNTTKNVEKHGKRGILMMPNDWTEAQTESLKQLCHMIGDFSITIFYDLKITDGMLDGKELYPMGEEKPWDLVERYINRGERNKIK